MTKSLFLLETSLPELGTGSGLAVWSFRACALGHGDCCVLMRGFERAFGDDADPALRAMLGLVRVIGHQGRRKVSLGMPGCVRITRDELSLLMVLAAAQSGDSALRDAHLTWLNGRTPCDHMSLIVERVADLFGSNGYRIKLPQTDLPPIPLGPGRIHAIESGRA